MDVFDVTDGFELGIGIGRDGNSGRLDLENGEEGEEDEENGEANLAGGAIGTDLREVAAEKVAVEEDGEEKRYKEAGEEAEPDVGPFAVARPHGVQEAREGGFGVEEDAAEEVQHGQQVAAGLIQEDEGHEGDVSGGFRGHGMLLFSARRL